MKETALKTPTKIQFWERRWTNPKNEQEVELMRLFRDLKIGPAIDQRPDETLITPRAQVYEFRVNVLEKNRAKYVLDDKPISEKQALATLLKEKEIPYADTVKIGVLWGKTYSEYTDNWVYDKLSE